ncbi:MAG: iron-containing alcohol dehydrogenase [Eubacteriaceae bacterium]|jgi:alcohol dehydrogenase class IV|nr:iron-containing alcohol dehydrogenase [Eubacteriaceae bacterium]
MAYPKEYYTYGQKCPVYEGPGVIKELGPQAKAFGCKKLVIVTDPGLAKTPVIDAVKKSLEDAGVAYALFDKINVDPLDTIVYEGEDFAKAEKADGLVGVGGGSSMDAAKSIAILMTNPRPLSQYYYSWDYKPGPPLFEVPTTTGTGSECTSYSVISDTTLHVKKVPLKNADMAFCDAELTYGLPPSLTAATGLDAFAHAAETMTGLIQNPHTDALCSFGIKELCKYLVRVVNNPGDKEGREHLMRASNLIGIGFGEMGCHLGHAIGQCIGAKYHTTHGISCAWALPVTMEYSAKTEADKVKMVADSMGLEYPENVSDEEIGKIVSDGIVQIMHDVHLQPMSEYGIDREGLIGIADIVMGDNCWPVIPSPLTKPELEELLGKCFDSYQ